jgi:hypothetical protein
MDPYSNDSPVVDDPLATDYYNVAEAVNATVNVALDALKVVPQGGSSDGTSDVMILLGCDFEWENALSWFENTDKLIHYLNLDGRVNAFYSTPSIYANAKLESGREYTLTSNSDLYPYDFYPHEYLTGFFTSRPALKGYIRDSSSLFASSRQMQAVSLPPESVSSSTNPLLLLEKTMAVVQHHDAVAGTSMQHVANDYSKRITRGLKAAESIYGGLFGDGHSGIIGSSCDLANASICEVFELLSSMPTTLAVYNSRSQTLIGAPVRVPVSFGNGVASYSVSLLTNTGTQQPIVAQLLPISVADIFLRR